MIACQYAQQYSYQTQIVEGLSPRPCCGKRMEKRCAGEILASDEARVRLTTDFRAALTLGLIGVEFRDALIRRLLQLYQFPLLLSIHLATSKGRKN